MNGLNFTLYCTVKFYKNKRKTLPNLLRMIKVVEWKEMILKNYLDDAVEIKFTKASEYIVCDCTHSSGNERVLICGKSYKDPDKFSVQLYDDISFYFEVPDK